MRFHRSSLAQCFRLLQLTAVVSAIPACVDDTPVVPFVDESSDSLGPRGGGGNSAAQGLGGGGSEQGGHAEHTVNDASGADPSDAGGPLCGDGEVNGEEECDDGNRLNRDGCNAFCQLESSALCGDGKLDEGEACDDGNRLNRDGCSAFCRAEVSCGNGQVDDGEACDDGNAADGDGCAHDCKIEFGNVSCIQANAEAIPGRLLTVLNSTAPETAPDLPAGTTMKRPALFRSFDRSCGTGKGGECHVGTAAPPTWKGLFQLVEDTFDQRPALGEDALRAVLSPDPEKAMPQGEGPGDRRACDHPMHELARQLLAFQKSGFADEFTVEPCPASGAGAGGGTGGADSGGNAGCGIAAEPYLQPAAVVEAQTNLGTCVLPAAPRAARMDPGCDEQFLKAKDAVFANAESSDDLPLKLSETDLVSLDSKVLLQHEVYSYSPAYTLFSDHAKKQRYFRLPVGEAFTLNSDGSDFEIPDNTRFYKTFLKPVTDRLGNTRYRKMETRLIVVRRDDPTRDGQFQFRALRATYAWNQDEREAVRVRDLLRNGEPFADRLCPYVEDENQTRDPALNPIIRDIQFEDGSCSMGPCTTMTEAECENPESGKIRHYAIPSAERCDQCHMGSNSRSYILGFSPWQVDHPAEGEGGRFEPVHPDELTQLSRLVGYGVVKGIKPGQNRLENSQLPRKPRNESELRAQAYMLGNCAFCHNPHGFPSVTNSELLPFNLWPKSNSVGGIFEFPLDLESSRVRLGGSTGTPIPYIYPAFGNPHGGPKLNPSGAQALAGPLPVPPPRDVLLSSDGVPGNELEYLAPWNSLIWRNVYTPFTYGDDRTIFVHMPRHVPGFDCRAHTIMADWMLSVPVKTKLDASGREVPELDPDTGRPIELSPADAGYAAAREAALRRASDYRASVTGQHCPSDEDIVEPLTINSARKLPPNDLQLRRPSPRDGDGAEARLSGPRIDQSAGVAASFFDGVPDHAHFVRLDTTDAPGDWLPRRPDWTDVLTGRNPALDAQLANVVETLRTVTLSPKQEAFSLTPIPMGLWENGERCRAEADAAASPSVNDLLAAGPTQDTLWLYDTDLGPRDRPQPTDRVQYQTRGQAVVRAICQNCHGADYDSRSPLAATISELTGGATRVANFRDGLLGPRQAPGSYAANQFTFADGNTGGTPADWQARYMLFMGLGGTRVELPEIALRLVAGSPFYGKAVSVHVSEGASSGNMLQSAEFTCGSVATGVVWEVPETSGPLRIEPRRGDFVKGNSHFWLWHSICSENNEPLIRVLVSGERGDPNVFATSVGNNPDVAFRSRDRKGRSLYPADAPVGTAFGVVGESGNVERGIGPTNTLPWCVRVPEAERCSSANLQFKSEGGESPSADCLLAFDKFMAHGVLPKEMPFCPAALFAAAPTGSGRSTLLHRFPEDPARLPTGHPGLDKLAQQSFRADWVRRGAINAGLAAYYYYDALSKGTLTPVPAFDACSGAQ